MSIKDSLIAQAQPKSPISEAYRVLRTNIQFSSVDSALKVIVVTSSGPSEGKSTTIANLAIAFAQSGSRVLLMDADLRKPRIHKLFRVSNERGMTNILAQKQDYKAYVLQSPTENLNILTSGPIPPNPSELLASNSMKQFLEKVKEDYDIVFIDAPPVGTVTDAAILSTIVDGTILVAASGEVQIEALQRSKELLDKVKANIVGVVLNKVDKNTQGSYYYYYYEENEDGNTDKSRKKRSRKVHS